MSQNTQQQVNQDQSQDFQANDSSIQNTNAKKEGNSVDQNKLALNPINVLWKILELQRSKNQTNSITTILHQERMLYFALDLLDKNFPYSDLPFDFTKEFMSYQNNVNQQAMILFHQGKEQDSINLLVKAIDMYLYKTINKYVKPIQKFGEMKVLSFNNLACIYQNRKQLIYALKAVQYAVDIEENLVNDNYGNSKKSIISTYLNKGAILSALNKHDKAIESLIKAAESINILEAKLKENKQPEQDQKEGAVEENNKNNNDQNEENKQNEDESIILKGYKLIALYNIGVENEHLLHKDKAKNYYQQALNIAEELGEIDMKNRINKALNAFK